MRRAAMRGFDPQFRDITDYILRITERIWEGRRPQLCRQWYSDDCPVYCLDGLSCGAEEVTAGTRAMQAAFPDRRLRAEAVVWDGDERRGFHSSHRIHTTMTSTGRSPFGAPTGRRGGCRVIAHCLVRDNRIVREWLVRDNWQLARQLGHDPMQLARRRAAQPLDARTDRWYRAQLARLHGSYGAGHESGAIHDEPAAAQLAQALHRLCADPAAAAAHYLPDAILHAPRGQRFCGPERIAGYYAGLHHALGPLRLRVEQICTRTSCRPPMLAALWMAAGTHLGGGRYGAPSGAPVLLLGGGHYRMQGGRIAEEWTLFDDLAVHTHIERHRARSADRPMTTTQEEGHG